MQASLPETLVLLPRQEPGTSACRDSPCNLPISATNSHWHMQSREGADNPEQNPMPLQPREQAQRGGWRRPARVSEPERTEQEAGTVHGHAGWGRPGAGAGARFGLFVSSSAWMSGSSRQTWWWGGVLRVPKTTPVLMVCCRTLKSQ